MNISEKDAISVYQFMEMCGLECRYKNNIKISHNAMIKKIKNRHNIFPENVYFPQRTNFSDVSDEEILDGKVVIVMDDYKKIFPYNRPPVEYSASFNPLTISKLEEERVKVETMNKKPGEIRYRRRKKKKNRELRRKETIRKIILIELLEEERKRIEKLTEEAKLFEFDDFEYREKTRDNRYKIKGQKVKVRH